MSNPIDTHTYKVDFSPSPVYISFGNRREDPLDTSASECEGGTSSQDRSKTLMLAQVPLELEVREERTRSSG